MKSAGEHAFLVYYIPQRMAAGIERYIRFGIPPGGFLMAVLENDLKNAVGKADDENMANLPAYVDYFYNHAPTQCWGSPEKVSAWCEARQAEVRNAQSE